MKTNAILRIIIFSLALFLLLGVLGVSLGVTTYMADFSSEHSHTSGEVSKAPEKIVEEWAAPEKAPSGNLAFDPSQIRILEIEWAAGSITIVPSDSAAEIRISESDVDDEQYRMVCKQKGDTLSIQFCKDSIQFPSFGINGENKDLSICVPAGWICDSLEIDAASADVKVQDLTIGNLDFDGASGNCSLNNCTVGTMDLDAASGSVTFSGCLDSLDFDGASADCALTLTNCPERIDLDGMSGSLDITLPSDCGFCVDTEGLSSDFYTDFNTTLRNGLHHYGDGACSIHVNALSGKVSIHDGGYTCHTSDEDCPDNDSCDTHSSHRSGHH